MRFVGKGKGSFVLITKWENVCYADEETQKSGRISYHSVLTLKKNQ